MTKRGQGPLNDPRLTERRGDLSGLNAALFVLLVIAAFIAAAYLLATIAHLGASSATPTPSAAVPSASSQPAHSPPSVSPSLPASPSAEPPAVIRQPVNVVVAGRVVGTVSLMQVDSPKTVNGRKPTSGTRWLAARVRYAAAANMAYDSTDWSVQDAAGTPYPWAGADFKPALGKGSLTSGQKWNGYVTFDVPAQGTLWLVFTGGEDGDHRIALP